MYSILQKIEFVWVKK